MSVQRDLSVLYGAYNSFLTLHFPDGHPMRLLGVLKFSIFLATNGIKMDCHFYFCYLLFLYMIFLRFPGAFQLYYNAHN